MTVQRKYGFENPFAVDPLVRQALRYCKGEKVLDVGCGEGADSVQFAQKGFSVAAIDSNRSYLKRLRAYVKDHKIKRMSITNSDVVSYRYPKNTFDVVSCILVICCMKRSEFERMLPRLKRSVRPGGIVIMSARNYMDPELREYRESATPVERNTFHANESCCKFIYFVERGRLRKAFEGFEILYYYEGYAPCKYHEHPRHGDSYIICRRPLGNNTR